MAWLDRIGREARYVGRLARLLKRARSIKPHSSVTIADVVERWARERPGKTALVYEDRAVTYRQYDEASNRVARWLQEQGVGRGDVVAVLMDNRPELLFAWLGVLKIGAAAALINHHLQGQPLAHTIAVSDARHVILDAALASAWASAAPHAPDVEVWATGGTVEGARDLDAALAEASPVLPAGVREGMRASDLALLVYTSGTTGLPKAARISHFRLLMIAHAFAGCMETEASDRIYIPLPMYHATGGLGGWGAAVIAGGTAVIRRRFSASHFWSDIVSHDCTMFVYIGELCRYLLNTPEHPDEQRHRIRCCMGNGLRPEIWEAFRDRFRLPRIVEFYGSSEGNVAFFNVDSKVGSVGRLPDYLKRIFPARLVRFDVEREEVLRGPNGRCIECRPGEVGEAIGRISDKIPGGRFEGYTDEGATRRKILTDVFEPGDRWYRTGDLLKRDEDGYFFFIDRVGDTFRWKGENVATSEVAEVVSSVPGVLEVNVYGVTVPDHEGRAGMASLVVDDGAFDLGELHRRLQRELAPYARPLFLRMQEQIAVTGTLKHRKVDLVREGFDPRATDEPLYFRDDAEGRFVPIDAALFERIRGGAIRL